MKQKIKLLLSLNDIIAHTENPPYVLIIRNTREFSNLATNMYICNSVL